MPIETEVISIASGTCWADEVEKEQSGNNFTYVKYLFTITLLIFNMPYDECFVCFVW